MENHMERMDAAKEKEPTIEVPSKNEPEEAGAAKPPQPIETEREGKLFEMALCRVWETPYVGKFKYTDEDSEAKITKYVDRVRGILQYHPRMTHTAAKGSPYDFTTVPEQIEQTEEKNIHHLSNEQYLSVKTNKKGDKVCPQRFGQASKKKWCEYLGLEVENTDIKKYILENTPRLLNKYLETTFECPVLYYQIPKNQLMYVRMINPIVWEPEKIAFSKTYETWNESSSLKYAGKSLGEFQIHNHRNNVKFRWNFLNLMKVFPQAFQIVFL